LPHLKKLYLIRSNILGINSLISLLTNLTTIHLIDLTSNITDIIIPQVVTLTQLKSIALGGESWRPSNELITRLTSLTSLTLLGPVGPFSWLTSLVSTLSRLQHLNLKLAFLDYNELTLHENVFVQKLKVFKHPFTKKEKTTILL